MEFNEVVSLSLIKDKTMNTSDVKRHLVSAGITFVSTFLVTMALAISDTSFSFTREALLSLALSAIVAGVRGIAKLIVEWNTST